MIPNNLEILHLTRDLMIEIHKMTVLLSNVQIFGEAKHVTESISSVTTLAACTEKKHYNYEFIKNLVSSHNTGQEDDRLETLFEKGQLTSENLHTALENKLQRLGNIMDGFRQSEKNQTS